MDITRAGSQPSRRGPEDYFTGPVSASMRRSQAVAV